MKTSSKFLVLLPVCAALAACSSIGKLQNKYLTKTLANGSTLHYNINVAPTSAWGCHRVGKTLSYNWGWARTKAQFHLGGIYEYLADQGVDYLNKNHIRANYMNMQLPVGVSVEDIDVSDIKGTAHLYFYQCRKINPNNAAGDHAHVSFSVS